MTHQIITHHITDSKGVSLQWPHHVSRRRKSSIIPFHFTSNQVLRKSAGNFLYLQHTSSSCKPARVHVHVRVHVHLCVCVCVNCAIPGNPPHSTIREDSMETQSQISPRTLPLSNAHTGESKHRWSWSGSWWWLLVPTHHNGGGWMLP